MMYDWLMRFGGLEQREAADSEGYTNAILQARLRVAEGAHPTGELAAIEAAVGLWSRAFMAATCDRLQSDVLGIIGRSLLTRGESVWLIAGLTPLPVSSWDIRGGADWRYRVDVPFPDGQRTLTVDAADVLHFRIGQTPARPWKGVSPLERCGLTATLLAGIERSLTYEFSGPVGNVLPVPNATKELAGDVAALKGNTVLGETTSGGWGEGQTSAPQRDWNPSRVGPAPGAATATLKESTERSVFAAAGVPVEIVGGGGQTTAAREAWRRFLYGTISPIGRVVGLEVAAKLGGNGVIDFRELMASDLSGRARAFGSLVTAGMSVDDARAAAGF